MLLEPPEHSPFLHQPPDDHKSVTQVDDYDGVNDANDNDDCSPKLVSFHHAHTFVDVPGKRLRIRKDHEDELNRGDG